MLRKPSILPVTVNAKGCAARLGISVWTVREWTHDGILPYVRVKRAFLYRVASIEEWAREHEVPATKTRRRV